MSRIHRTLATLSLLLPLSAAIPAFAQGQSAQIQKMSERFNAADTNHDGKLTLAEAQAGMPRVASHFEQIDSAHTGSITFDQLLAFIRKQRGG